MYHEVDGDPLVVGVVQVCLAVVRSSVCAESLKISYHTRLTDRLGITLKSGGMSNLANI